MPKTNGAEFGSEKFKIVTVIKIMLNAKKNRNKYLWSTYEQDRQLSNDFYDKLVLYMEKKFHQLSNKAQIVPFIANSKQYTHSQHGT